MVDGLRKNKGQKPRVNIATSCNDNYARYVFVNLANTDEFLGEAYDVHFYLIQKNIAPDTIRQLEDFGASLNLTFHVVTVTDDAFLEPARHVARAGDRERFYDGCCHLFLPEDLDRVLYIDTGDILFSDTTHDFYFLPLENKCIVASRHWNLRAKKHDFSQKPNFLGGFNGGHILINLARLRELGIARQDYIDFVHTWQEHFPDEDRFFLGDQGFLTSFFAEEILGLPLPNSYNVKVADLNGQRPSETPKCVHLNQMFLGLKPWDVPFRTKRDLAALNVTVAIPKKNRKKLREFFTDYENEWIMAWWNTCKRTPVYDDIKAEALNNQRLLRRMVLFLRRQWDDAQP